MRALALVFAALLAACSPPEGGGAGRPAEQQTAAVGVVTAAAGMQPLALEIEAVGTAHANESVEITSKVANTITAIRFEEGQRVRRGEVLVEFDTAQTAAELAVAEAALAESEMQFARSRELAATQALSRAQLEQIEATLKANRARVAAAKARLADNVIRAPFDGRVGFRRVSVGSLVAPGTVITTLDDASKIKLEFTVPQIYLHALEPHLPVSAMTAGLPGRRFEGRVTALDSRIDPVTRAIGVRAELPNEDGVLRPGMFMTVRLRAAEAPALVVPEQALVPEQGATYVYVVSDGVAQRRQVSTGRRRPGEVEIVAGLRENERVVVEGTQKVRDGVPVQDLEAPVSALAAP